MQAMKRQGKIFSPPTEEYFFLSFYNRQKDELKSGILRLGVVELEVWKRWREEISKRIRKMVDKRKYIE